MKKVFISVDKNEKRKGVCLFLSVFFVFFVMQVLKFLQKFSLMCICENGVRYNIITSIRARIRNDPSTYLRGHFSSSSANVAVVFVLEKTIYYYYYY